MNPIILDSAHFQEFLGTKRIKGEDVVFTIGAMRAKGILDATSGALIATTKRLVFFSKGGFLSKGVEESLEYSQVTNVSFEAPGPLGGRGFHILVSTAGRTQDYHCINGFGFDDGGKSMMGLFRNALLKQLEASKSAPAVAQKGAGDPRDRLLKIKAMFEEGLLSEEEYQSKRKQILNDL